MECEVDKILNRLENLPPLSKTAEDVSNVFKDLKHERDVNRERYTELLEQSLAASKSKYNLVELQAKIKVVQRNYNNKEKKLAELEAERTYWELQVKQLKNTYDSRVSSLIDDMQSIDKMEDLSYESRINELTQKHKQNMQKVQNRYDAIIRNIQTRLEKEKEKSSRLEKELASYKSVVDRSLHNRETSMQEQLGYSKSLVHDKESMIPPINTFNDKIEVKDEPIDDGYDSPLNPSRLAGILRRTPQKTPSSTEINTNISSPNTSKLSFDKTAAKRATKSFQLFSPESNKNERTVYDPKIPTLNVHSFNHKDEYKTLTATSKPRKSVVLCNKRKSIETQGKQYMSSTSKHASPSQFRPVLNMPPLKRRLLSESELNTNDSDEEHIMCKRKFFGKDVY